MTRPMKIPIMQSFCTQITTDVTCSRHPAGWNKRPQNQKTYTHKHQITQFLIDFIYWHLSFRLASLFGAKQSERSVCMFGLMLVRTIWKEKRNWFRNGR